MANARVFGLPRALAILSIPYFADLLLTQWGLGLGLTEVNPIAAGFTLTQFFAWKFYGIVVFAVLLYAVKQRLGTKWARGCAIGLYSVYSFVCLWNLGLILTVTP